jgi:hypothetical protein
MTTPIVRDRSNGSFPGSVTHHGCAHVGTSDAGVAAAPGSISPDGGTSQAASVPSERPYSEVATVYGGDEPCTAVVANRGGDAGEGIIHEGDPAEKAAGVKSHPDLMRAHQKGSYTKGDHEVLNGDSSSGPMPQPMPDKCEPVTKAQTPATFHGGRSNPGGSNEASRKTGLQPLSMSEVMSARRAGVTIQDSRITDSGAPQPRQGKPVLRGPAVATLDGDRFGSV